MQRPGIVFAVCTLAVLAVAAEPPGEAPPATSTAPAGPVPRLRCDQPEYIAKNAWAGDKVEHDFVIANDGQAELQILNVRSTCGCTVAPDYDRTIAPGGTGRVRIILTTSANAKGRNAKQIHVDTNDPAAPEVVLTIGAELTPRLEVEPTAGASWGRINPDSSLVRRLTIRNRTDTPMRLAVLPPADGNPFRAELRETEPGRVAELTITAVPPFREGFNAAQIRLSTGLDDQPELVIPCSLFSPALVEVVPNRLLLTAAPDKPFERTVLLRYNHAGSMEVLATEFTDPQIPIRVEVTRPGRDYRIVATFPPGYQPPRGQPLQLTIRTDLEQRPAIVVPVMTGREEPPPPVPAASAEALIDRPAPVLELTDAAGQQVRIEPAGRLTVLNFWATWCSSSRRQVPIIADLARRYARRDVDFVQVAVDQLTTPEEVQAVARAMNVPGPVRLDRKRQAIRAYGATRVPLVVVIDREGVVRAVHRGMPPPEHHRLAENIAAQLDVLLAGKGRDAFPSVPFAPMMASAVNLDPLDQPASSIRPACYVESSRHDVGLVRLSEPVRYTFRFRNIGLNPLRILSLNPSPDLKILPDHSTVVEPGADGFVNCTFTTPSEPRPFVHALQIRTDDLNQPDVHLTVTGQTRPFLEVDPPDGADFSDNPQTHSVPRLVTLVWNAPGGVKFGPPVSSSPRFSAVLKPTPQEAYTMLIIEAHGPFEPGEHRASITVPADCATQPSVEVPVRLTVPQPDSSPASSAAAP